jgi:CRP-like cAMP-binding protein
MIDKHLLKLRARDEIGPDEEAAIRSAVAEYRDLPADKTIIEANRPLTNSTLLLEGLMCRYKDLSDGQRQITELHVPGDFVDLHSFTLKHLDHAVMTLTRCKVAVVPHANLERITERFPHLTRVLWFTTLLDACIAREGEVSLGRRTAIQRTAHFFCELRIRMGIVGMTDGNSYPLDVTQIEVAECLGLTSVHVNRVLKELRERGIMEFRSGQVTIFDVAELERVADFDANYLYLRREPL